MIPGNDHRPGSYRLSGNLTVPNANTDAIVIAANHVTIDLNGFSIIGPVVCTRGVFPCAGAGTGSGIRSANGTSIIGVTVRNGSIRGMGTNGVSISGDSLMLEYLHVRDSGIFGIRLDCSARASHRGRCSYSTIHSS